MVLMLTGLFAYVSTEGDPDFPRLAGVMLAVLASQLCVGWSNDYIDRDEDNLFQPFKPVPSGQVEASWLLAASLLAGGASLAIALWLGLQPLVFVIMGTGAGLAYNLGLKGTAWSWLPYLVGFAVLPAFVWTATDSFQSEFLWLYPVCASLTLAAHLANILPDIETDRAAGSLGLGIVLGKVGSLALLAVALLLPLPILALSSLWVEYKSASLLVTLAVYLALLSVSFFAYRLEPFRQAAVLGFRFVVSACVFFAGGWLASI